MFTPCEPSRSKEEGNLVKVLDRRDKKTDDWLIGTCNLGSGLPIQGNIKDLNRRKNLMEMDIPERMQRRPTLSQMPAKSVYESKAI